jgi:hypothetical protein
MRYRYEMINGKLAIRHVQTDRIVGRSLWHADPDSPNARKFQIWLTYKDANGRLVECGGSVPTEPLKEALSIAALNPEYPAPAKKRPDTARVELLLGEILADAAVVMGKGLVEYCSGVVSAETKEQFGKLMERLYDVWYPSRFASYNAERRDFEPYFRNRHPILPRLNFAGAAQTFGMGELEYRFPDTPEPILKELLTGVIECFGHALRLTRPATNLEHMLVGPVPKSA